MFVFLCQIYITFNSKLTVSECWVGVVYLYAMIKKENILQPLSFTTESTVHPPLSSLRARAPPEIDQWSWDVQSTRASECYPHLPTTPPSAMPPPTRYAERRPNWPQMALSAMALSWFHLGQRGSGCATIITCLPPNCSPCLRPCSFHRIVSG